MDFTVNGIQKELQNRLETTENWQTSLFYGVYNSLVLAIAYIINKLAYTTDFFFRESKWSTALRRKSIIILSKLLQYTPYRKIGATGSVIVSGSETFNSNYENTNEIILARWTELTDANSEVNVYVSEDTTYYRGFTGNLTVPVKEGQPKEYSYIAEGIANEQIFLYSDSVEDEIIEVFIVDNDGNVLETVNIVGVDNTYTKLYFVEDTTNTWCEVKNSDDYKSVYIEFGDNENQKGLNTGDNVLIKYADTLGSEGNITSSNIVVSFKETIINSNGTEVTLYVNNTEPISDGSDIEDIESIRNNGNNFFFSGYRNGSKDDWETNLNSLSFVSKAKVWNTDDVGGSSLFEEQNKLYYTAVSIDGSGLTSAQEDYIEDLYGYTKKSVTEILSPQTLEKMYVLVKINAFIKNIDISSMKSLIKSTISNTYSAVNTDFKVNIYDSNIVSKIDSLSDIIRNETEIFNLEYDMQANLGNYEIMVVNDADETDILTQQIFLNEGSVELWIKRKINGEWLEPQRIAKCDPLDDDSLISDTDTKFSDQSITGESLSNIDEVVSDTLSNIPIQPLSLVLYDDGVEITFTETDNKNGTGTLSSEDFASDGSINYTTGTIYFELDATPTSITCDYVYYSEFNIQNGIISYPNNEISYIVNDIIIDTNNSIFGEKNPSDENADRGYILGLAYKTKDGNGEQTNSVRLPNFYQITDIDEDFIISDLNYE